MAGRRPALRTHLGHLLRAKTRWEFHHALTALQDLYAVPLEARLKHPGKIGARPKPPAPPKTRGRPFKAKPPAALLSRSWRLMSRHRAPLPGSPEWHAAQPLTPPPAPR